MNLLVENLDPKEALTFLEKIKEKTKLAPEANILCCTSMGNIYLLSGDHAETKVSNCYH